MKKIIFAIIAGLCFYDASADIPSSNPKNVDFTIKLPTTKSSWKYYYYYDTNYLSRPILIDSTNNTINLSGRYDKPSGFYIFGKDTLSRVSSPIAYFTNFSKNETIIIDSASAKKLYYKEIFEETPIDNKRKGFININGGSLLLITVVASLLFIYRIRRVKMAI